MSRKPSVGTILLLVMYGAVVLRAGTVLGADADYLVHRAYGEAILAARTVWLPEDPTIFTAPGAPPILHEWGAEALFAALARLLGDWGPLRLTALVAAAVPWMLYRRALERARSFWPALVAWMAAASALATGLLVRPHLFSLLAFALVYQLLDRWRAGDRRALIWLAPVIVAWTNLHGGGAIVLYGVLALVFSVTNPWRSGVVLLPLSYGLTLLNPWGPRLHLHIARFLASAAPRAAADMGPPPLLSGTAGLLFALALLLVMSRRQLRTADRTAVLLVAVTFALSCLSMRSLPFLGIALGYLLPELLAAWIQAARPAMAERSRELAREERGPALVAPILLVLSFVPTGKLIAPPVLAGPRIPQQAIAWLRTRPTLARQHGYAGYDDGGFLLGAHVVDRVYLHSLNANTPLWLAADERTLSAGASGWEALLRKHEVTWALVRPDEPLAADLVAAGWQTAWTGGDRTIYQRRDQ